ncbi:MAG: primosomal protein N' [Desulfovibrionaceae bacterium]|nr:primosomal protein N' [Desulfovibrionaceae bacterium]
MIVAQAALMSPPFTTLSYILPAGFAPEFWKPGLRLAVPLGRSLRAAVLLESGPAVPGKKTAFTLKEIIWPLEQDPLLSAEYLEFARQLALRQAQPLGRALAAMLPAGLRDTRFRLRFFKDGRPLDLDLPETARLDPEERAALARLWQAGQALPLRSREKGEEEICRLRVSPPWPLRPFAKRQIRLLDFLEERRKASRKEVLEALGTDGAAALKALLDRGLVEIAREEPETPEDGGSLEAWLERYGPVLRSAPPFALNQEQRAALEGCLDPLKDRRAETRLLYGITGSGKGAVYLELAARTLLSGRGSLLLAPELALAGKLQEEAQARFPGLPTYLFHSDQSPARREACFRELARSEAPYLAVGARSALFLPLKNLGLIVLDEEHDASFKQDERFSYNAKELAWFLAHQQRALLLLGSATPDLKSFHAAEQGRIPIHRLDQRAGGGEIPAITLEPLPAPKGRILTTGSAKVLQDCLERGEQAVILLNRRGFAPSVACLACGKSLRCPDCEISFTYHKGREKLLCHYCGRSADFPRPCPDCGSSNYLPLGQGTEKLEEQLNFSLPPGARILRLDRDSAAHPGGQEEILHAFAQGRAEVLVGTQMISKGHHFPRVTLSIVADGDLGLNMLDYNAAERTFQLILQTAGRSGRGEAPGRVIVQTRDPSHYCWHYILAHDYPGFYREELERRRRRHYPPFCRMALIRLNYPRDWDGGERILQRLSEKIRQAGEALEVTALGPAPAPRPLREKRLRFHCLLKGRDWQSLRAVYRAAATALPPSSPCRLSLDLDPAGLD